MCVRGGGRTCEEEDSEQHEFYNGFLLHSVLFGLIIRFLQACPDPRSCLSPNSPFVTKAESSPAILYYRTTTFKYLFIFFLNHRLSLRFSDSLFSPFALYSPSTCNSICLSKVSKVYHFSLLPDSTNPFERPEGKKNAAGTCTAVLIHNTASLCSGNVQIVEHHSKHIPAFNFVLGEMRESTFSH